MAQEPDQTVPDIDAARAAYRDADAALLRITSTLWIDGQSAADWLMEVAEEKGADLAVQHMLGNAEGLGPLSAQGSDSVVADIADTLEEAIERVLVAQERLDEATVKRETALRGTDPARPVVVNFGGREFVIDAGKGELRSVENPTERYRLADDALARSAPAPAKPSLTEKLAKEAGIAPVKPAPPRDRTRVR